MFNYKDLTYLRVATLAYIEKLSLIEEDGSKEDDDRFAEVQDDIQYLSRLRDAIERAIATSHPPTKVQITALSVVPNKE